MISSILRRPWVLVSFSTILLVGAIAWAVFVAGHAIPPRRVVMTTGPEGGAYRELGEKYKEILARFGVRLETRPSLGNVENLRRLKDPKSGVSVGFVSGGLTTAKDSPNLVSLGTVAYYPLWIFCRGLPEPIHMVDLRDKRVSVGPEGGGTRPLAMELLRANGIDTAIKPFELSPGPGGEALLRGELDCACMLTTAEAPIVRRLLGDKTVSLVHFYRADAYVARYPFLRKVILPEGVGSLSEDLPNVDVPLVASTASLLIRDDLHPAIQFLLLQAADEIHSPGSILDRPGQFPSPEPVDVPLSSEAKPFYKSGGSYLQRHLPFWLWVFTSRLLLLLVPIVGVLYPLTQVLPAIVDLFVNVRLNRYYAELRDIEMHLDQGRPTGPLNERFRRLEKRVNQIRVPSRNARTLYGLKFHVDFVRMRLSARDHQEPPKTT
ncbi:MAG TPA: TAXI family TRAP transporter solute-binding subunit [Thermoanaerobaculia bacterium]|nr:TAXI family TRAP transporter solute-binding subunit [Thermoanaerobaculia bacterium]